jgi:hypothetical protein
MPNRRADIRPPVFSLEAPMKRKLALFLRISVGLIALPTLPASAGGKIALPPALSISDLSGMSGGASPTGVAITNQSLSAVNVGNQVNADSLVTGNVTLQSGAFSGFNGVGNFVFNTGNNNNVQGTLSVTIIAPR